MNTNWITMTKGGEEKLVHPGNVGNHLRFGWVVVGGQGAGSTLTGTSGDPRPAGTEPVSVETPGVEGADAPDAAREAALAQFGRVLESARKHPEGLRAKAFEALGVNIQDPPGPAAPWPVHVLMASTIDALVKIAELDVQAGLIGKSAAYARGLVEERSR